MSTNNIKSSNGAINNNNNNETTSLRSSLVQQAEAHTSSRTALEESLNIKSSAKGNTLSRPSLSSVKNGGGDLRMGAVSSPSHRHSTTSTNFRASSKPDADNNINVQSSSRHSLLLNNSNSKIVQIDTIATSDYTTTNNNNITSNDTARTSGIIPKSSSNRNLPAANTSRNTVREGDGGGDFGPATGPQLSSVNEEDQAATGTPLLHRNSSTTLSRKQGGVNEPPSFKAGGDVTTSSNNINRNASIHSIIMERVNNSIHSLKESGSGVKTEEGGVGGQQALSKSRFFTAILSFIFFNYIHLSQPAGPPPPPLSVFLDNNESRHSISKNNAALATGDQDNIAGVSDTTRRFSSIQNPKNVTDLKTLTMSPKSSQTQLAVARSPRSSTRHLNENGYTKIISAPKVSVQKATLERSRRKQQASHASGINSDTDESAPKTKKSKSRANIMNNTASDQSSSSGGGSSSSDYEDASENEEEVDDGGVPVKSSYDNRKQQKHMSTFEYLKDSDFKNSYNAGSSTKNTHNQQSSSMYQSSKSPRALAVPVAEGGNRFRAVGGGATRQTVEAIKRSVHVENTSSGNLGAKILNQSHSSDLRQNEIIQKLLRNDRVQHRGGGGGGERGHGPGREGGGGGHDGVSQNNKYRINKQPSNQNLMSQNASQNALNTDNYNQGLPAGDRHRQQQQEDNYQQQILGDLGAGYDQEKMYRDRQADTYASQTFDFIDNNIKEPGQRRAINGGTLARRGKSYDTLYGSRANTISQVECVSIYSFLHCLEV